MNNGAKAYNNTSSKTVRGNVADNWRRWLQQFNLYMNATGRDGKDEKIQSVQYSTFLTIAGEDALEIYN
ncbi:hypothetical protein QZH41_007697 [Actinostola sp. cb2023]|nr:hypothetical protein QZH41_007697 [Actinostola sp. cb2023]